MGAALDVSQVSNCKVHFSLTDKKRIAVCFFGITRSLSHTIESIRQNVLEPARRCGEVRVFAHLFDQHRIFNPRSKEDGTMNPYENKLLGANELISESPGDCLEIWNYDKLRQQPDPWADNYHSLRNFLHQMHSIMKVGRLAEVWKPSVCIYVRPDQLYVDSLMPYIQRSLQSPQPTLYYPNWQHHGGMNDRFAIASHQRAAEVYSRRGLLISECRQNLGGPFNGERLLKYAVLREKLASEPIYVRAYRMRLGGIVEAERFRRPRSSLNKTTLRYLAYQLRLLTSVNRELS